MLGVVAQHRDRPDATAGSSAAIQAPVHDDPSKPRSLAGRVPKLRQALPGEDENVLRHVSGLVRPDDGDRQPMDCDCVSIHECLECFIVVSRSPLAVQSVGPSMDEDVVAMGRCSVILTRSTAPA